MVGIILIQLTIPNISKLCFLSINKPFTLSSKIEEDLFLVSLLDASLGSIQRKGQIYKSHVTKMGIERVMAGFKVSMIRHIKICSKVDTSCFYWMYLKNQNGTLAQQLDTTNSCRWCPQKKDMYSKPVKQKCRLGSPSNEIVLMQLHFTQILKHGEQCYSFSQYLGMRKTMHI